MISLLKQNPKQKLALIRAEQPRQAVAIDGDGHDDAPALAQADVGSR